MTTTESFTTQNRPLDQFFLERNQSGFIPLLNAQTDDEINRALAAGKYLTENRLVGPSTTHDFYDMLNKVTAAFSPSSSDNRITSIHNSWGDLLLKNFRGSLGVDDYKHVVETTKKTADYLVKQNIYCYALPAVQAWIEEQIPIMPMLEDASKRHLLLIETPKIVGGLPYYLIHKNNEVDRGSLIRRIFDEQDKLTRNGAFTRKIDDRALEVEFHRYSYRHMQTMADNFVSAIYRASTQNKWDAQKDKNINSVTGLELRDLVRQMLKDIQQREDSVQLLSSIRNYILYRSPNDKQHKEEYPPALTDAYISMTKELEPNVVDIDYETGIRAAETWLTQASSITTPA